MITFQILLVIRTRAFVNVALFCTGKIPGTKNKPIKSIYTSSSTVNLLCKETDKVFFFFFQKVTPFIKISIINVPL